MVMMMCSFCDALEKLRLTPSTEMREKGVEGGERECRKRTSVLLKTYDFFFF